MDASKLIGYDGVFATRLRDLMKNAKATQQDVAAAVGTTRQAISQYADGSVQPNIEKLYKIANYFNVSADYLLGIADVTASDVDDKAINQMLGLSEKAISKLKQEDINAYDADSEFREFVNIFADIDTITVDGLEYDEFYLYQSIMRFLKYKKITCSQDLPEGDDLVLVAFKHSSENPNQMDFYKPLPAINEESLLTVFLFEIQRELRGLKNKIEEVNYFADGGASYRLKEKQESDALKRKIDSLCFEKENFDVEAVNQYFKEKYLKIRQERLKNMEELEKDLLSIIEKSEKTK